MIFSSFELEHITYEEEVIDCLEDEFKVEKYSQEIKKNKSNYQKPIYFAKSMEKVIKEKNFLKLLDKEELTWYNNYSK